MDADQYYIYARETHLVNWLEYHLQAKKLRAVKLQWLEMQVKKDIKHIPEDILQAKSEETHAQLLEAEAKAKHELEMWTILGGLPRDIIASHERWNKLSKLWSDVDWREAFFNSCSNLSSTPAPPVPEGIVNNESVKEILGFLE